MIVALSFPNPIGWAIDKVTGFIGGVATAGFEMIIGGLVAWVMDAVIWVVGGVFAFFLDSTDPNVQADWFVGSDGPYATTAAIGATLLVGFMLAGITQGVLAGDVGGMLRQIGVQLPVAVLGMVGLVTVVQALIKLTDDLSTGVLSRFEDDVSDFSAVVTSLSSMGGPTATALVVFLLGLVTVIAGVILLAELVIRAALVYIVVALAPLVFAAQMWPALRGMGRKLLELTVALILSKLVIAVALAVSAAAMVGAGSGGEITALPEPEVFAEDPGGSVTQAVGILLAAVAAFGVAAFSPLLLSRLMPLTEAALVAQGIRGMPARGVQQTANMAMLARPRGGGTARVANGPVNGSSTRPAPSAAKGGPVGVGVAVAADKGNKAAKAASAPVNRAMSTASHSTPSSDRPSSRRPPPSNDRRTKGGGGGDGK